MTDNPSTRHAFYCQDNLWAAFIDLATARNTTIDALINEAMSRYVQAQNMAPSVQAPAVQAYGSGMPDSSGAQAGAGAAFARQPYGAAEASPQQAPYGRQSESMNPMVSGMQMGSSQGLPAQAMQPILQPGQVPGIQGSASGGVQAFSRQSIPAHQSSSGRAQAYGRSAYGAHESPAAAQLSSSIGVQGVRNAPPTPPPSAYRRPPSIFEEPVSEALGQNGNPQPIVLASLSAPQSPAAYPPPRPANSYAGAQPPLYILFSNQKYTVDKDKYIIGRSSQLADLVIRDGNVSRKHCAIIFKNGAYYIKDLDSTNGIEYKGNRIDTKRIEEGDQFNICEFHFTFTYRG